MCVPPIRVIGSCEYAAVAANRAPPLPGLRPEVAPEQGRLALTQLTSRRQLRQLRRGGKGSEKSCGQRSGEPKNKKDERCAYGAEVDSNDSAGRCGDQEERAHGIDRVGKLGARRGPAHEAARVAEEGHPLPRGVHTQHLFPHTHTHIFATSYFRVFFFAHLFLEGDIFLKCL